VGKISFKMKIKQDNIPICNEKRENFEDFDNIIKDLKKKFGGKR